MLIKESRVDRIFNFFNVLLLSALLFVIAYPLYFIVIASFSDPSYIALGQIMFIPRGISWTGYKHVLQYSEVWIGYRNTILYTTLGTLINLAVTLPAAYSLSRSDFRGKGFFTAMFMVPMFFGGGLIPTYLLYTQTLHINDTIWVMVIPGATGLMQMVVARTFFNSNVPHELRESAVIDGCSNFRLFFQIVLPLSTAIIAVQALQTAVGHWNAFFNGMMYLSDRGGRELKPLQLILRDILISTQITTEQLEMADMTDRQEFFRLVEQLKYALIIVSVIPILIVYPFAQKHFVKGVLIGAIKG